MQLSGTAESAFSGISLDRAHEENNKLVKGDGEVMGLLTFTLMDSVLLRSSGTGNEYSLK